MWRNGAVRSPSPYFPRPSWTVCVESRNLYPQGREAILTKGSACRGHEESGRGSEHPPGVLTLSRDCRSTAQECQPARLANPSSQRPRPRERTGWSCLHRPERLRVPGRPVTGKLGTTLTSVNRGPLTELRHDAATQWARRGNGARLCLLTCAEALAPLWKKQAWEGRARRRHSETVRVHPRAFLGREAVGGDL